MIESDPEPVHATYWARTFWGARVDVKISIVTVSADRNVNQITTDTYQDGSHVSSSVSYEAVTKYQIQIIATAGHAAAPCLCLAKTEAGSVLINVT